MFDSNFRFCCCSIKSLIDRIPDVSNEEVDDLNDINYASHAQTASICSKAKKKLTRLSSTSYGVQLDNVNVPLRQAPIVEVTNECLSDKSTLSASTTTSAAPVQQRRSIAHTASENKENSSGPVDGEEQTCDEDDEKRPQPCLLPLPSKIRTRSAKSTRTSCPARFTLIGKRELEPTGRLFPSLAPTSEQYYKHEQAKMQQQEKRSEPLPPPPTYSDSESCYTIQRRSTTFISAAQQPSAPPLSSS